MNQAVVHSNLSLPGIKEVYRGKVRDVYHMDNGILIMVATDRISAFDVVLPRGIPYKGQVLNQIAGKFLDATADIVPNWKLGSPDPMVTVGYKAETYPVEMVIRGYLTGHAWREYRDGKRVLCGVTLKEGMQENQKFDKPIITPTTKAHEGHDEDISREEILEKNIIGEAEYKQLEAYTHSLFQRGTEMAAQKGLILVDTKYEFGKRHGKICLIDEIHTPDSSRYFYKDTYQKLFNKNQTQRQLSKEFVRQWLIENGFQGKTGQQVPEMDDSYVHLVSERYIELYEKITGEDFQKESTENINVRLQKNIGDFLQKL